MNKKTQHKGKRFRTIAARIGLICLLAASLVILTFTIVNKILDQKIEREYASDLTKDVHSQIVDGASIAYRVHGNGQETILLIHGLMGSSHDFAGLWPDLSRTRTVVSIDLIGFGLSDKSTKLDYSKENMAKLCGQLMLDLGYDKFTVLGHSMGGEVALNVAILFGQSVQKLILVDSAGTEDLQRGFTRPVPVWMIEGIVKNYLVQRIYFPAAFADRAQATSERFNQFYFFNRQIPGETLQKLIADNDSGRLKTRLGEIDQPTLVVWGRDDKVIPLEQACRFTSDLPQSELVVIDAAGHLPFIEKKEETLQAINSFLDQPQQEEP